MALVSKACSSYLKSQDLLLANNEHYDAIMAFTDTKLKPIRIFRKSNILIKSEKEVETYFFTTKCKPITSEMVTENSKKPPSKAKFKLKKKVPFYLFQKTMYSK